MYFFFFEILGYKDLKRNEKVINMNKYLFKYKLINILQYLIIIIICTFNIYLTYNIKININYNKRNNTIFRKINEYVINCERNKLVINGIQHSLFEQKITAFIILYNAEKTILTSIRSIQNQNMSDIEILLIDDFSSDNSLKIIEKCQKEDKRINIIKNNKNRGSLFSRSLGVLKAKGKYIMALDSDDLFINENLFNLCYKESEKNNLDIIEFSGFQVKSKIIRLNNKLPNIAFYLRFKENNLTLKQPDLFNFLYKKNNTKIIRLVDGYLWGKCIRKKTYIKTLSILGEQIYKQYLNFGEDRIVNFVLFKTANSFKFIEEYGIIYIYNPLSIFHSYNKELIAHDELINLMSIFSFTKNTTDLKIVSYEIKYRWKNIIKPGLNFENKKNITNLINLLLNSKFIEKKDKLKLAKFIKEII